jgi:hypothetical protein
MGKGERSSLPNNFKPPLSSADFLSEKQVKDSAIDLLASPLYQQERKAVELDGNMRILFYFIFYIENCVVV